MSTLIALLLVLVTYGIFRLLQDYVRRSMNSFSMAESTWPAIVESVESLLSKDIPSSVAKLVVGMASAAGCGCFVRALIVGHYLPRFPKRPNNGGRYWSRVFSDVESLDAETRALFWQLLAQVIVYDSFRNPLQGWFFRRALKEIIRPNPGYQTKLEAQVAVFSVVSKRGPAFSIAA